MSKDGQIVFLMFVLVLVIRIDSEEHQKFWTQWKQAIFVGHFCGYEYCTPAFPSLILCLVTIISILGENKNIRGIIGSWKSTAILNVPSL